jgi:hypothetical protein
MSRTVCLLRNVNGWYFVNFGQNFNEGQSSSFHQTDKICTRFFDGAFIMSLWVEVYSLCFYQCVFLSFRVQYKEFESCQWQSGSKEEHFVMNAKAW